MNKGILVMAGTVLAGGNCVAEGLTEGDTDGERIPATDGEGEIEPAPADGEALGP